MFHAAPSYGSAFPTGADWIMDTGAASHVTGDPGTFPTSSFFSFSL